MREIDTLVLAEGWYDLEVVDGKLWGFINQNVMPQQVVLQPETKNKILELEAQKLIPHSEVSLIRHNV
jgi:hypothetical protein